MRLRQATLSPWLRSLAALALVVFVVAQAMCFVHCHFGGGGGANSTPPSCHAAAPSKTNHESHDAPPWMPAPACSTLMTMLTGGDAPKVHAPPCHILYTLVSTILLQDAGETLARASLTRQACARDWVFTPEVSLGPAFHSHAPPSPC